MTKEERELLISVAKAQQVILSVQFETIRPDIPQAGPLTFFDLPRQIGSAQSDLEYSLKKLKP